jgi:predicted RND superfamily exporter protein
VEAPEDLAALTRLREMARQPPLTREQLPREILQRLGSDPANGQSGAVLVYPAISLSRGDLVLRHAAVLRSVAPATSIAGEAMVLADILETVRRESRGVLGLALLGIFLTLWGLKRRLRPTLIALASAGLSLVAGLGALSALGMELNYLSMVAIPVLFGVAVDGAVHLVEQAEHDAGAQNDARRAIAASLATTALGFGALLIADHPGLRSLGLLALLGLAANALVSLWVLPALLELAPRLGGLSRLAQRAPPVAGH